MENVVFHNGSHKTLKTSQTIRNTWRLHRGILLHNAKDVSSLYNTNSWSTSSLKLGYEEASPSWTTCGHYIFHIVYYVTSPGRYADTPKLSILDTNPPTHLTDTWRILSLHLKTPLRYMAPTQSTPTPPA